MYAPLDQTVTEPTPLQLTPSSNVPMSPDLATIRSGQVSWAFDLPPNDIYNSLVTGNEDSLREGLAAQESQNQTNSVAAMIRKNPFAVSPALLASMTSQKDPRDIIEKKYAEKALDHLTVYDVNSVDESPTAIKQAAAEDPVG